PDRDVALGLRGGRRIVNVSAQLAQRIIDFKSTVSEATAAPRLVIQAKEPGEVANSLESSIVKELVSMGHELKPVPGLVMGAHGAEFLKRERKVRSGGNSGAAGVGEGQTQREDARTQRGLRLEPKCLVFLGVFVSLWLEL